MILTLNYRKALIFLMFIMLVGCNTIQDNQGETEPVETTTTETTTDVADDDYTDEAFFEEVNAKMNGVMSYMSKVSVSFGTTAESVDMDMDLKVDMEDDTTGVMELDLTLEPGSRDATTVENYISFNDENLTQYTGFVDSKWIKHETTLEDTDMTSTEVIKSTSNIKSIEFIEMAYLENKTEVDVFDLIINDQSLIKDILNYGDLINEFNIDEETIKNINEDIKVRVYVDIEDHYIRKMEYDLRSILSKNLPFTLRNAEFTFEFSHFNEVSLAIPAAVKNNTVDMAEFESKKMKLDFTIDDLAIHTNEPIIYAVNKRQPQLYVVNYESETTETLKFESNPETLYYRDGKIYVAFTNHEHSPYINSHEQSGKVMIIDAETLETISEFSTENDPFDMVVDDEGYIYVGSGSGQTSDSLLQSYNEIGLRISSRIIDAKSYIVINDQNSKIYSVDTLTSPRDLNSYDFDRGRLSGASELKYHGQYRLTEDINVSPDGNYLYNGFGHIFTCAPEFEDMNYLESLVLPYNDIVFDYNNHNQTYAALENIIVSYSYEEYELESVYSTEDPINTLYFNRNQLIAVGTDYINVIDEGKTVKEMPQPEIPDLESEYESLNDVNLKEFTTGKSLIPFEYTDLTIHPSKPIIYATHKDDNVVRQYNYETGDIKEVEFNLPSESLYYRKGKLYVTLLKGEHKYYGGATEGAIGIVDANDMTILDTIDIDIDPYDLVVDNDGYMIVSGGSNQHTNVRSYNSIGLEVDRVGTYMESNLKYDFRNNQVYVLGNRGDRYTLEDGKFVDHEGIKIEKGQDLYFSPDGNYIYMGNETLAISTLENQLSHDLEFYYTTITFDEHNEEFYTARHDKILQYNYTTNKLEGLYHVDGKIQEVYNNNHQLIILSVDQNNQHYIEIIKQDHDLKTSSHVDEYAEDNQKQIELLTYNEELFDLTHTVTDAAIHPTNPVLYLASAVEMKLYTYNYLTQEIIEVPFENPVNKVKVIDNSLYVGLGVDSDGNHQGSIIKFNLDKLTIINEYNLTSEFDDFTTDQNGNLFIKSYNTVTRETTLTSISEDGEVIDQTSLEGLVNFISPQLRHDKLIIENRGHDTFNTSLIQFDITDGLFNNKTTALDDRELWFNNSHMSPDGDYIYNGNNNIGAKIFSTQDFSHVASLDYYLKQIVFLDEQIYTINHLNRLYVYDRSTLDLKGYRSFEKENDVIKYFFVHNGQMIFIENHVDASYKVTIVTSTEETAEN